MSMQQSPMTVTLRATARRVDGAWLPVVTRDGVVVWQSGTTYRFRDDARRVACERLAALTVDLGGAA